MRSLILSCAALTSLLAPASALPQPAPTIVESYQRARSLLDAAVAAHGGTEALRAARNFRVRIEGWDYHPTQGRRLTPPFDSTPRRIDAMVDLDRGRIVYEQLRGWPGGFYYTNRFVTDGDSSFNVSSRDQVYSVHSWPRAEQQFGNLVANPVWFLIAAVENQSPGTRRYLGRLRLAGSNTEVEAIHYSLPQGGNIVIGLDPVTHQLRATLSVGSSVFEGDAEFSTEFLDWRMLDGMLLPARAIHRRAGRVHEVRRWVAAQTGYQIPDSLLRPPAQYTVISQSQQEPVRELARGVWLVGAGSKSLVVEFADHLVVVDAPAGGSADVIARAPALAPGKPIRYVVPTHHHDDHFSGVRHYAAKGVTIVTTEGNRDYLRRILAAPMSSTSSASSQAPPSTDYRVEMVARGQRTFTDGSRTLEIHQIANPHAEEMLVAWLPSEGILFQADIIQAPDAGTALRGANAESTMQLASVVREKGWAVRTFAGAHSTLRDSSEFLALTRLPLLPPGP